MIKELRGITWAHTRGLAPLQVTSQVYTDFHPDIKIVWDIRSLHAFGEGELDSLTKQYDLLLLDHPFMGVVSASKSLLPLDEYIEASTLKKLSEESVGQSYQSYYYDGHQWALPVDAAAQVACSRMDLLTGAGFEVPKNWEEVMLLAAETKKVAMPMTPMALLGSFFTLCANQGEQPFANYNDKVVDFELGESVLLQLRSLYQLIPGWCLEAYPPYIFYKMATTGEVWYVPISYGYVNYSMKGYAPYQLTFHDLPASGNNGCSGATLGGVGIAVSANSLNIVMALDYISWIAGADCQKTIYPFSGGQPANSKAWDDDLVNAITNNFYGNTRQTLEKSFMRPRYNGFHAFQSFAGRLLQDFLKNDLVPSDVINQLNTAFISGIRKSKTELEHQQ